MKVEQDYKKCLEYIESYWEKIIFYFPKDKKLFIGLPNPFVSPNTPWLKNFQFYWDSYFSVAVSTFNQAYSHLIHNINALVYNR